MKANRAYDLTVRRGSRAPALTNPDRLDTVEIVEIDSGEVALFWDTTAAQTRKLVRALRADLSQLEAGEFIARWRRYQT